MAFASGARLGVYQIGSAIGAGGMGEVYAAQDTALHRDVAIKVLPERFAADRERLARFEREARVLASLNHPNIATVYGLERAGAAACLVMEFVPGETLANRIVRGRVPIEDALQIALQITAALEAAHDKGIVHRDLKPANVIVTPAGKVKILDFGLAKALSDDAPAIDVTQSPTMAHAATMAGVLLGTAAYMSPEQARGKPVDKRSDIWAFGCVLYEMLSGKQAFHGETLTDIVAAVVKNEPDWKALPREASSGIRALLRRCLIKEPSQRLHDIADCRIEIEEAIARPEGAPIAVSAGRAALFKSARFAWAVASLFAVATALLLPAVWGRRTDTAGRPLMRLELNLPEGIELYTGGHSIAISADGQRVAFVGIAYGGRQLFVRSLDQLNGPPLQLERIRPTSVFFSPTGHAAAFMAPDQVLRKITLADGLVVTLVRDTDFTSGGAWGSDDRITFVREGALWQIAASGGTPQRLTTLDTNQHEVLHGWPASLPGGKVVLFACVTDRGRTASRIEAVTVATGRRRVLIESGTFPMYAASGHLIFYRDRALLAVPFNVDRLETTAAPVRVLAAVPIALTGSPLAALSETGTLVYAPIGSTTGRLVSVSRQGIEQTRTEPASSYASPRISADGRRVVATMAGDLWIHDTARATSTRLTAEEGAETYNSFPIWTPDAKRIVFRSRSGLRVINADGTGRSEVIPGTSISDYPTSVSPDGETLAFARILADTASDVYVLSLHGDPKPRAVVSTPAYEGGPVFSPNGHWIAYASDESGQMQVYVRPYPRTDRKWQVSTHGGTQPQWNSNGQELFYRDGNKLMAVDVTGSDSLTLSQPHVLFERDFGNASITIPNYDVGPNGRSFVVVKNESELSRLDVVLNWFTELKRLAPATPP